MIPTSYVPADTRKKLIPIKDTVVAHFTSENWLELGTVTNSLDLVQGHDRLLRSLYFNDSDYPGAALAVLISIIGRDGGNFEFVENYVEEKFGGGEPISSTPLTGRKLVFAPNVFSVPDGSPSVSLVSLMMPFTAEFREVHEAVKEACKALSLSCMRADDIWEHSTIIQDIFALIFRSQIVVCDFTGRNPNVFYEAGIAHTLGKHVIPITQSEHDVPFDLRHHRHIRYHANQQGLQTLRSELEKRLGYLTLGF